MQGGALWERVTLTRLTSETESGSSLPTPVKYDSHGTWESNNYHGLGWRAKNAPATLYPTPLVSDGTVSKNEQVLQGVEEGRYYNQLARVIRKQELDEAAATGPEHAEGKATSEPVRRKVLPTPTRSDSRGQGDPRKLVKNGAGMLVQPGDGRTHGANLGTVAKALTFPTPTSENGLRGSSQSEHHPGMWQSPGHPEFGELSPEWVEWLMGWPTGWTSLSSADPARFASWEDENLGRAGGQWSQDPSDSPSTGITKTVKPASKKE